MRTWHTISRRTGGVIVASAGGAGASHLRGDTTARTSLSFTLASVGPPTLPGAGNGKDVTPPDFGATDIVSRQLGPASAPPESSHFLFRETAIRTPFSVVDDRLVRLHRNSG